ncbi:MAG: hypothetical protein KA138_00680 [Saprospiraceae bacterium]|jgi:hypothetical protein|nr:hypothetical protein [Lewinellaceae bacterium]MBP6810005.1 hypothetical protein [Saprospiraceae bacterium]
MQRTLYQSLLMFFLLCPSFANAQDVWQLMAARDFHDMKSGPEKTERIRDLAYKGWVQVDTFLGMDKRLEYHKIDLTPFVDDMGESVFLVTDVSPEFPGGTVSSADYFQNLLSDLLSKPGEVTQNTLYIKFSVQKDGKIEVVSPAQPFPEWVPAVTGQRCLEAVRDMPIWSPGRYKERPVKVSMLMVFSLRA